MLIYILEHHLGYPGIALIYRIVAKAWNFYHTCHRFLFLSLWFYLLFIYLLNESMGISLYGIVFNFITNHSITYVMENLL